MSNINDGGPAFPTAATATTHGFYQDGQPCMTHYGSQAGISVRDYFAAAALHGLCEEGHLDTSTEISQWAYSIADAMMERRKR